jgi:hypothetical protein
MGVLAYALESSSGDMLPYLHEQQKKESAPPWEIG